MLKRFEVRNYKNFEDTIVIDFSRVGGYHFNLDCITSGSISKMLIYGRNATGKTNLGRALMDIAYIVKGENRIPTEPYTNANSNCTEAEFKYVFQFEEDEVIYMYKRVAEDMLHDEELYVNGEQVFFYDNLTGNNLFSNLNIIHAETARIDRFLEAVSNANVEEGTSQDLPFLRWVISNTAILEESVLLKLNNYVRKMAMIGSNTNSFIHAKLGSKSFYERLLKENKLQDFEEFLNVMGVECHLSLMKLPDGQMQLYFKYENALVPFLEAASSGTLALMALYSRLMILKDVSVLYIDEFDAFYHYEMSEKVVNFFKKKFANSQIVMTTHNTNLMTNSLMRPDCLFILSRQGLLTALCDATPRELREGHNLEKLYISGEFEDYE